MARMSMRVDFSDRSTQVSRRIVQAMKDAMTDVTLDLKRVASQSAPHDTGYLERNASHSISVGRDKLEGVVGFSAVENGFNYAQWTHDKQYNLGEKSAMKTGGRSGIGGGGMIPVGTGYLKNTLEKNKRGYIEYLKQSYREAIR